MPISRIPGVGLDSGSGGVAPSNLSTGGPYWDGSGNVGIGTTSPGARLDVVGATGAFTNTVIRCTDANMARLTLANSNRSWSISNYGAQFSPNNALAFADETAGLIRLTIDASGNLLVGTTSVYDANYRMQLAPAVNTGVMVTRASGATHVPMAFQNSAGTFVGSISCTNTATTYSTSSDYRLKENIQPMQGALARVAALKPCIYTWKADGSDGEGFIAHELAEVVPDAVMGEKDAVNEDGSIKPQGIDTSFLVATLTAAIQELNAKVEAQAAEIAALKGAA